LEEKQNVDIEEEENTQEEENANAVIHIAGVKAGVKKNVYYNV
jgi:hypothetical protein